jgi:hypothetical protein
LAADQTLDGGACLKARGLPGGSASVHFATFFDAIKADLEKRRNSAA